MGFFLFRLQSKDLDVTTMASKLANSFFKSKGANSKKNRNQSNYDTFENMHVFVIIILEIKRVSYEG